jgi:hypothetical protein
MFSKFAGMCTGAITYSSLTDLGGIGTDPVFNVRSSLYNAALDASDWWVDACMHVCACVVDGMQIQEPKPPWHVPMHAYTLITMKCACLMHQPAS